MITFNKCLKNSNVNTCVSDGLPCVATTPTGKIMDPLHNTGR